MRTRIALVAIIPVAVITVSTLTQTALGASAQATPASTASSASSTSASSTPPVSLPASTLTADHGPIPISRVLTGTSLLVHLNPELAQEAAFDQAVQRSAAAAAAATTPAGPTDTVTPDQRAAWERVAMCEEGGDWHADGGRFSGGLGVSRANWIAYGGDEFAPEGAMATEDQQIMVAERIQSDAPDQDGCRGW